MFKSMKELTPQREYSVRRTRENREAGWKTVMMATVVDNLLKFCETCEKLLNIGAML